MAKRKNKPSPWTTFWDMHSGGGLKEKWDKIFIEAPQKEAISVFYARFGHSPGRVSCTCCGEDYSVNEDTTLLQATGFHRGCETGKSGKYLDKPRKDNPEAYLTEEEYLKSGRALAIRKDEITPEERKTDVPEQGYVWQD